MMASSRPQPLHKRRRLLRARTIDAAPHHGIEHETWLRARGREPVPAVRRSATTCSRYYEPRAGFAAARSMRSPRSSSGCAGESARSCVRASACGCRGCAGGHGCAPSAETLRRRARGGAWARAPGCRAESCVPCARPLQRPPPGAVTGSGRPIRTPYEARRRPRSSSGMQGRGDDDSMYGFPRSTGATGGVKVATEQYATTTTPERVRARGLGAEEMRAMYERYMRGRLPGFTDRMRARRDLPLHGHPGRGFVIDAPPELRARDRRLALLRPRLQALGGDRRSDREMVAGERPALDLGDFAIAPTG